MRIESVMSRDLKTCRADDSLNRAAQLMWECDIGCVPVVDHEQHVVGIVTDRDICMAAYTQGRALAEISVANVMGQHVVTCEQGESVAVAERRMQSNRIRRLPVLRDERLVGMITLNDIARAWRHRSGDRKSAVNAEELATTLASICEPRPTAMMRMHGAE